MPVTDRDLIRACREGDLDAWERLVDQYERLVYSIPLSYGLGVDDAADVAQVTFTILMEALARLPDDSRLGAWLATVARRHTWRALARRRREPVGTEADVADSEIGGAGDAVARWETVEWLDHGLRLLDERCRALLLALYFDPAQPSYAQVAGALDVPLGSIGPTRARCLERMKRLLTENADGPLPGAQAAHSAAPA